MNGRKRKIQIKFYVTEEERALIEQKMKLVPTRNMAAYLRKIAIDGYIIQTDHSDIKGMTAEIQKIGVNINQIAKRVNATGSVYQEDIEEIKGVLAASFSSTESPVNQGFFCPYYVTRARRFLMRSAACLRVIRFRQSGQYLTLLEVDAKEVPHSVQRFLSSVLKSSAYSSLSRGNTAV